MSTGWLVVLVVLTVMARLVEPDEYNQMSSVTCHLSLKDSGKDLNDYYPGAADPTSLPLLRISSPNYGDSDSCVLVLTDCVNCGCLSGKTAILTQAHGWNMSCVDLDPTLLAADARTIGRGNNRDRADSATVLTNRALVGGLPTESLESILIAETDAPVFQPRIAVVQAPVATTTPIVTATPTTVLPPMMKQRDAYDELRILSVVQSYLSLANIDDGPDARNLDAEDDFATMPANDTTTATATTLASETTTGAAPTTVKDKSTTAKRKDVQHDDKDDDNSFLISNEEYLDVVDQMSSWRNKYFVVLGFFLCFTIIFVIIISILCIKLKKAQSGNPGNVSPGPGCDTEPLTPQVQEGNFKFDGPLRR